MKITTLLVAAGALLTGTASHANLVLNGSFEAGSVNVVTFARLFAGSRAITSWIVDVHDVDYAGSGLWNASDGNRSVDLDGATAGSLSQSFATVIGTNYVVTFDLSGNPGSTPYDKLVRVSAGATSADFTHTIGTNHIGNAGAYPWTIPYESHSLQFTATSAQTKLTFASLTNLSGHSGWGPVIDKVDVELAPVTMPAVPEPSSLVLMALGLAAVGFVRRPRGR
jgi:choice-of-anchor C domain-containing protein